jgi:hypothetical protein
VPELTPGQLADLDDSPRQSDRIAATIARKLAGQSEGTPVGSDVVLSGVLGVSGSTVGKAKRLLRELGVITKSRHAYYVH